MKRFLLFICSLFAVASTSAVESKVEVYSNGDYGLDFEGLMRFKEVRSNKVMGDGVFDEDGNFYFLTAWGELRFSDGTELYSHQILLKLDSEGNLVWKKIIDGSADRIEQNGGYLYIPILTGWDDYLEYDGERFAANGVSGDEALGALSYYIFKINLEDGSIEKYIEIEIDHFSEKGFDALGQSNGFSFSKNGDIWFMSDIDEEYKRLNKDIPLNLKRFGDNDKVLIQLSKDLEFKGAYSFGSDGDDNLDMDAYDGIGFTQTMLIVGDTMYLYIPFRENKINVSLYSESPYIVKETDCWGCNGYAAFCKYFVKGDSLILKQAKAVDRNDWHIKRFAVNSKGRIVGGMPPKIGLSDAYDSFYELMPDLSLKKLEGYAYNAMWSQNRRHRFWFDQNDDIIKMGARDSSAFSDDIVFAKKENLDGNLMFAKFDGNTLENKWVLNLENAYDYPQCRVDASRGKVYLIAIGSVSSTNFDPNGGEETAGLDLVIARYKETYRVKSKDAEIVVNGGKDMVRHGEDAEVEIKTEEGMRAVSVTTSRGEVLPVENNRCVVKDVREPITLSVETTEGEGVNTYSSDAFAVYPNPAKKTVYIRYRDDVQVSILDANGRNVLNTKMQNGEVNIESLPSGTYYMTINNEVSARIVKE